MRLLHKKIKTRGRHQGSSIKQVLAFLFALLAGAIFTVRFVRLVSFQDSPTVAAKSGTAAAADEKDTARSSLLYIRGQTRLPQNRKFFVDLGANCGNTFLKFKERWKINEDDEWEVYLWEPNPQMHQHFLNDLAKEHPKIKILPYAAGASKGNIRLFLHRGQEHVTDKTRFRDKGKCEPNSKYNPAGGSTVFENAKVAGDPVDIQQLDFIAWLKDLGLQKGDRFLLKMDIEGSELEILERMLSDHTESSDDIICLVEKLAIEFHKEIFNKGTELYQKHEEFENNFRQRFEDKCGHQLDILRLF